MITIITILLIAMSFAWYMHQRVKIMRERDHERRMKRFENLMELLKKQHSEQNVQESDTTEAK